MRELSFVANEDKKMATIEIGNRGKTLTNTKGSIVGMETKKSRQTPSAGLFTQEQILPLVQKEVSALARQHVKIREPTDFLKIQ